ncbi:MAG TPA: UDP-diphosphatase [Rikenellaceae bacterium]|nr:UDP-diphosphatase [Rikenellaceae bacterium]
MEWWEALLLGLVQGLTEFLPVSSSGHLTIFRELLGVDPEGFLDFTVTVHFATVLSTIVVFWSVIVRILKGVLKFKYNDETDYFLKICVSMIPVAVVGLLFKDKVEALFGDGVSTVAICLIVTAALLMFSDFFHFKGVSGKEYRNGISYWQAALVGLGQACAVAPGLSRSGTTIATGLVCGVKRENMAQFSFLMVLVPIMGEQLLSVIDMISGEGVSSAIGFVPLICGFVSAFVSGLLACSLMVSLVKKAKMRWFALYCVVVAALLLIFM